MIAADPAPRCRCDDCEAEARAIAAYDNLAKRLVAADAEVARLKAAIAWSGDEAPPGRMTAERLEKIRAYTTRYGAQAIWECIAEIDALNADRIAADERARAAEALLRDVSTEVETAGALLQRDALSARIREHLEKLP